MKERFVTLVCALGALGLFLAMFLQGDATDGHGAVPHPTTEERQGAGYRGVFEWLAREHRTVLSGREPFNKLSAIAPGAGNLLVVTLPAATAFQTEEFRALDHWVRGGNTLLVLAALVDAPDWAFEAGRQAAGDVTLLTGLEPVVVRASAGSVAHDVNLVTTRPHPYFEGVRTVAALSEHPAQGWTVHVPYDGFMLALARERETGTEAIWLRTAGRGRVIVSSAGSLFTNRALGLADNARLFANIVGATVAANGVIAFDDFHQGLTAAYDPEKFYSDPRLYATVGILAALWLCWIFGSMPLRVDLAARSIPREAELVKVTGGFLSRVLTPAAAARGLFTHFFRRVAARLPAAAAHGSPPWEALSDNPRVTPGDLRQLRDWYTASCAGEYVPLHRLYALLRQLGQHKVA